MNVEEDTDVVEEALGGGGENGGAFNLVVHGWERTNKS